MPLVVPLLCNLRLPLKTAPSDPLGEAPNALLLCPQAVPAQDSRAPPLWPGQAAEPADECSREKWTKHCLPGSQISLLELDFWGSRPPCNSEHWDPMVFLLVPPGFSGLPEWEPETLFTMKEVNFYVISFLQQARETKIVFSPALNGWIQRVQ